MCKLLPFSLLLEQPNTSLQVRQGACLLQACPLLRPPTTEIGRVRPLIGERIPKPAAFIRRLYSVFPHPLGPIGGANSCRIYPPPQARGVCSRLTSVTDHVPTGRTTELWIVATVPEQALAEENPADVAGHAIRPPGVLAGTSTHHARRPCYTSRSTQVRYMIKTSPIAALVPRYSPVFYRTRDEAPHALRSSKFSCNLRRSGLRCTRYPNSGAPRTLRLTSALSVRSGWCCEFSNCGVFPRFAYHVIIQSYLLALSCDQFLLWQVATTICLGVAAVMAPAARINLPIPGALASMVQGGKTNKCPPLAAWWALGCWMYSQHFEGFEARL